MNTRTGGRRKQWLAITLLVIAATLLAPLASSALAAPQPPPPPDKFEETQAVEMLLPDRAALNKLVTEGFDLDHNVRETDNGVVVTVIATPREITFLKDLGFVPLGTVFSQKEWEALREERAAAMEAQAGVLAAGDTITILRADYWQSELGDDVSIEAKSSAGASANLTATWQPAPLFGITCTQAIGLGSVPENTSFQYSVRLSDPGTASGSGHVTNRVWQGTVEGPAEFDVTINWPISPSEGSSPDDSSFSWEISVPGGVLISKDQGSFDCAAPLPTVDPSESTSLRAFVDAGEYLYHRRSASVNGRPDMLTVSSDTGASATTTFREWLPDQEPKWDYQRGFIDHYMDPTEIYARIEALAAEFPDLAEIIDLPYLTNGYRRQAMGLINGQSSSSRVVITSQAWGHEGGNGLLVETVDPGSPNQPLEVSVSGGSISISLATDGAGSLTSTAAEVIAAVTADPEASSLVRADPYRESSASGLVSPQSITLSDYLNAPAEISREPFQVRAIRIGRYRDGSRLGVLAYAQEHAREWVPPLVTVETAERLLRNYANGGHTKELLDNLDIFIIPSVNPDGGHYSFYDYNFQRKNMVNYCLGGPRNDPNSRNTWGVDVNRNYDVGSLFDGYDGASNSCSSTVYSGPSELSEAESKNVVWLADTFDNIKFSMNIHSSGNYFMWSPGAYIVPGRESLPRPTLGQETFFWYASERILQAIKASRGLVVTPGRTGPIVDVLYSAAGNSGDRLWYENGFYAWNFEVGTSFQPNWDEAYQETLEFSNGLIELFQVAKDFENDNQVPNSWLVDSQGNRVENQKFEGLASLTFMNSEPATIYYTMDGSRPTFASPLYSANGIREPGAVLYFTADTTLNWFAIDAAGNTSSNYDPDTSNSNQYYSSKIRFR
ncbi:MAG: M14 family metallopeptidase [Anaerolineales bacterium]